MTLFVCCKKGGGRFNKKRPRRLIEKDETRGHKKKDVRGGKQDKPFLV